MYIVGGRHNGIISVLIFSNIVKCFAENLKSRDDLGVANVALGQGKKRKSKTSFLIKIPHGCEYFSPIINYNCRIKNAVLLNERCIFFFF